MQSDSSAQFYEFFCGGGLARLGLEPEFACVFANDIDPAKASAYRAAFGDEHLRVGDVWKLAASDLPGQAALAWASFPCQDLSLAGARRGLAAPRSGAFWGFHRLIEKLAHEGRAPDVLALETIRALDVDHILPGHGPVVTKSYLDTQRSNLLDWVSAVAAAVAKGWTREETIERVNFADRYPVDIGQGYMMDHIQTLNAGSL